MSTYYKLISKSSGLRGGFITRQVWGYGNVDVISTLQFILYVLSKGATSIEIVSEHDKGYDSEEYKDVSQEALSRVFPHDDIWDDKTSFDRLYSLYIQHKGA